MTDNRKSTESKGKPSGSGKEGQGLKDAHAVIGGQEEKEITDKYMDETDQPADNVPVRHPNRNTDKGRENQGEESTSI